MTYLTTDQLDDEESRYLCPDGHMCVIPVNATDDDRSTLARDIASGAMRVTDAHCSNVHLIIARDSPAPRSRMLVTVVSDASLCTLCHPKS